MSFGESAHVQCICMGTCMQKITCMHMNSVHIMVWVCMCMHMHVHIVSFLRRLPNYEVKSVEKTHCCFLYFFIPKFDNLNTNKLFTNLGI